MLKIRNYEIEHMVDTIVFKMDNDYENAYIKLVQHTYYVEVYNCICGSSANQISFLNQLSCIRCCTQPHDIRYNIYYFYNRSKSLRPG